MEYLSLQVQDIDFARNQIMVRDGKCAQERRTMLPETVKKPLQKHLQKVKAHPRRGLGGRLGAGSIAVSLGPKVPRRPRRLALAKSFRRRTGGKTLELVRKAPIIRTKRSCNGPKGRIRMRTAGVAIALLLVAGCSPYIYTRLMPVFRRCH
jgi:hypothetical protein